MLFHTLATLFLAANAVHAQSTPPPANAPCSGITGFRNGDYKNVLRKDDIDTYYKEPKMYTNSPQKYPMTDPVIRLDYGRFRGKLSPDGKTLSFLGIPFAAPPVGNLRFRAPQPPEPISKRTVFDATQIGNGCIQDPKSQGFNGVGLTVKEDCLNLNVYTPANATENSNLPVIVYIYGGGFNDGYNNIPFFNGANFLAAAQSQQAVIVVPNYRTNVFGFLASAELAAEKSLNVGLLDQRAAFEWVRRHIRRFGGNRKSVTAWGQSAGAMSIATHMIARGGSLPLFDRAILHSGAVFPVYNTPYTGQASFDILANSVGCAATNGTTTANNANDVDDDDDDNIVLSCLRKVNPVTLFNTATLLRSSFRLPWTDPTSLSSRRSRLLLASDTDEGTFFAAGGGVYDSASSYFFQRTVFSFLSEADFAYATNSLYPMRSLPPTSPCTRRTLTTSRFFDPDQAYLFGVYHGAELPYAWNFPYAITPAEQQVLTPLFVNAYLDFAANKTPGISSGSPWPSTTSPPKTSC
ncbi:Alpha/Beta hydrolase protein [Entophlyctis helioformis]|nr:Alpha/Beta hydrolase protein [Entophlyctis helioformis]